MLSDTRNSISQRLRGLAPAGYWWTLVLVFLAINVPTLYNGHNWGDDFAQYLRHAQNILEGKPYADGVMLDKGPVSPVGFPLMLAPLLLLGGGDFAVLKVYNIVFWVLYVWAITGLARRFAAERESLLVAACFFSSPFVFIFKQNILTDIPFVAVLTAAVGCFMRYGDRRRENASAAHGWFWAGVGFAAGGLLMRWSGAILFLALLVTPGVLLKRRKEFLWVAAALALCGGLSLMAGASFLFHLKEARLSWVEWGLAVLANIRAVFMDMLIWLFPLKTELSDFLLGGIGEAGLWLGSIFAAGLVLDFLVRLRRKNLELDYCFLMLYFGAMVLWPISGGGRYVLPIVGLVFLQAMRGWRQIFPQRWAGRILEMLLIL